MRNTASRLAMGAALAAGLIAAAAGVLKRLSPADLRARAGRVARRTGDDIALDGRGRGTPDGTTNTARPALAEPVSPGAGTPAGFREDVAPAGPTAAAPPSHAIPDEYVFRFYSRADRDRFIETARDRGAQILDTSDFAHAVRIRVTDRAALRDILREGPTPVDSAPNHYAELPTPLPARRPPRDAYVGFGAVGLRWLGLRADNARWGEGVTVAVVDTGVLPHPALAEANIERIDLVGRTDRDGKAEARGHGTAVASLLAAYAGGIRGVAPAARVLSVKVISENGTGDTFTFARGIVEAVDRGARVVNVSMGTRADDFLLRQAVEYALSKDVLIVAAAGNDGVDGLLYPARYPGVLAVSGVDASGRHLYFSNRGNEVALAAPGLGVAAAGADGDLVLFSGTSPAAPFVSGAAAWLLSEDATLTASRIRDVLAACADDTGEPGADPETGAGVLNFRRLQERNTRGVRDIALSGPFARSAPDGSGDAILTIFAENRGTEDLRRVEMKIEGNGVSESRTFYNVRVSETVSCAVRLSASALAAQGGVRVTSVVTTPGVADAYPQDNGPRTTVLSRASTRADLDVR